MTSDRGGGFAKLFEFFGKLGHMGDSLVVRSTELGLTLRACEHRIEFAFECTPIDVAEFELGLKLRDSEPERDVVLVHRLRFYLGLLKKWAAGSFVAAVDGRLRIVDNIGMMEDGITTSGFTQ